MPEPCLKNMVTSECIPFSSLNIFEMEARPRVNQSLQLYSKHLMFLFKSMTKPGIVQKQPAIPETRNRSLQNWLTYIDLIALAHDLTKGRASELVVLRGLRVALRAGCRSEAHEASRAAAL